MYSNIYYYIKGMNSRRSQKVLFNDDDADNAYDDDDDHNAR